MLRINDTVNVAKVLKTLLHPSHPIITLNNIGEEKANVGEFHRGYHASTISFNEVILELPRGSAE